jgi:hypothetical protein
MRAAFSLSLALYRHRWRQEGRDSPKSGYSGGSKSCGGLSILECFASAVSLSGRLLPFLDPL